MDLWCVFFWDDDEDAQPASTKLSRAAAVRQRRRGFMGVKWVEKGEALALQGFLSASVAEAPSLLGPEGGAAGGGAGASSLVADLRPTSNE